jgi:hypothetical protein
VGGAVAVPLDIEFSGPRIDKQPAFVQVNNLLEVQKGSAEGGGGFSRGRAGRRHPSVRQGQERGVRLQQTA